MNCLRLLGRLLALIGGLLGQGGALSTGQTTPEGDWIGWHCRLTSGFPSCTVQRLALHGRVLATAASSEAEFQAGQLVLSRDGRTLYNAGAHLHAWDAHTLKLRWTATPAPAGPASSVLPGRSPSPLALSPDGRTLAAAGPGPGEVEVRDTSSGQLLRTIPHPRPSEITPDNAWSLDVTALAYDPTGQQLAIGSRAGGIRLHDLATRQERRLTGRCGRVDPPFATAHRGSVSGLVWTGPTTLVSTANDETIRRWDTSAGREVTCLSLPGGVQGLQVLPGDRLLALGVTSATLLDAGQFRRVARLGPFAGVLRELSVLGDAVRLADEFSDRGWKVQSGRPTEGHGQPLAGLDQLGVRVRVGPDMRVTVTRGSRIQTLSPAAVPPSNADGSGSPSGWTVERSGPVLTVTAKASVRIGVMDMADIENVFRWNLTTGHLERCDTVSTTVPAGQDRACPGTQRSP